MSAPVAGLAGLREALAAAGMETLADPLLRRTRHIYRANPHGDWRKWRGALDQLAGISASSCDFARPAVRIGEAQDCAAEAKADLKRLLLQLRPWRKGPFEVFGVMIDSEWRANLKWARLAGKISNLRGRRVLDVGCGNGYYLWRMLGEGASIALGIDPTQLFIAQFNALKRYCPGRPAFVLPLKSEEFPVRRGGGGVDPVGFDTAGFDAAGFDTAGFDTAGFDMPGFDTVFSMGVLSHRRDPRAHLRELLGFARPGGEVVVETLVVDGDADTVLVPAGRYAKMRNVHAIPSAPALAMWLRQAGAADIRLLGVSKTTGDEQRATDWMQFESLADFLDPADAGKTIEGHPAPQRGIFLCRRDD